jgi:hypothetical protein
VSVGTERFEIIDGVHLGEVAQILRKPSFSDLR